MELLNPDLFNVLTSNISTTCSSIPPGVKNLTSLIVLGIQVVVPILLIIWGMLDFTKAVIGQNEDKIKDAQKVFIKRLIAAAVVFLTVTIVKLLLNLVGTLSADNTQDTQSLWSCINEFIGGTTSTSTS